MREELRGDDGSAEREVEGGVDGGAEAGKNGADAASPPLPAPRQQEGAFDAAQRLQPQQQQQQPEEQRHTGQRKEVAAVAAPVTSIDESTRATPQQPPQQELVGSAAATTTPQLPPQQQIEQSEDVAAVAAPTAGGGERTQATSQQQPQRELTGSVAKATTPQQHVEPELLLRSEQKVENLVLAATAASSSTSSRSSPSPLGSKRSALLPTVEQRWFGSSSKSTNAADRGAHEIAPVYVNTRRTGLSRDSKRETAAGARGRKRKVSGENAACPQSGPMLTLLAHLRHYSALDVRKQMLSGLTMPP